MTGKGHSKITGVVLGELIVDTLGGTPAMNATFALERADSVRVGKVTKRIFSERTNKLFLELVASLEADMLGELFEAPEVPEAPKFEEPRQA